MARPNVSPLSRPKLLAWLRDNGKTQEWLGRECGVRQTTASQWVRGSGMTVENALRVAKVTGLSVEDVSEVVPREVPTAADSGPALDEPDSSGSSAA